MQFKFRSRSNVLITPYKMLHEFCLPFFKTVHLKEIWVTYGAYLCKKIKKWIWYYVQVLKYGFHYKSFILNAPLVSCPIPVIGFGSVCRYTHSEQMTGIGQLTIGAFRINDLWNPYFRGLLILKCSLGVFKSSKNQQNFLQSFCPSLQRGEIQKNKGTLYH